MGKTILTVDAGGTKSSWQLFNERGEVVLSFITKGINSVTTPQPVIEEILNEGCQRIVSQKKNPSHIYFYGAGCRGRYSETIADALEKKWIQSHIEVNSDMTGCARALFGNKPGVACILGTGSNSCLYDGKDIKENIPSLGYILGDEGSGAALGKRLINALFKGIISKNLKEKFISDTGLSLDDIFDKVYHQPTPNQFLASLSTFINRNINYPEIRNLVQEEFSQFFIHDVIPYNLPGDYEIGFCGSIAIIFSDILKECSEKFGLKIGKIISSPDTGLIDFHSHELSNNIDRNQ